MKGFHINSEYMDSSTGIEYFFYVHSPNPKKGTFYNPASRAFSDLDYSVMRPARDSDPFIIKYDCIEYEVSKDIKERYDAIIQEARDYEATH